MKREDLGPVLRGLYRPAEMGEDEIMIRAREAYIATNRRGRLTRMWVRRGWLDRRLRAIIFALRDTSRPLSLILQDRDEATCALILRCTPGIDELDEGSRMAVASALMTAVRMGRHSQ